MRISKSSTPLRKVPISEFKAKCLALLDQVDKTRIPLRVLKRGRPIADVVPVSPASEARGWIGSMSDTLEIAGDIVSPVINLRDLEALKG